MSFTFGRNPCSNYDTPTSTSEPSPARPAGSRTLDLPAASRPTSTPDRPELDRFAVLPSNPRSPEWLAIEDSLPADHRRRPIDEAIRSSSISGVLFASYLVGENEDPSARFDAQDHLVQSPNASSFA